MRSGNLGRWAAVAGAVLLTGACGQANAVAGISAHSPTTSPSATATTPQPSQTDQKPSDVKPPKGDAPVRVPPPKLSKFTYVFPVKGCTTTYQRKLLVLPKTTIWAGKGCAFVAPVGGVVDEVNTRNKWRPSTDVGADREGRFVTIIGDDGVRYLGGHLDAVSDAIKPGMRVSAGQLLGSVGTSGNARDTGSNLYFAISWKAAPRAWWVRRGMVEPWDYLDAWLTGNRTFSPRDETLALRRKLGEEPACAVQCKPKKAPQSTKTTTDQPSDPSTISPTTTPWGR
ncbi:M23 family metallopeptidase [Nonomuraea sp. NPDC000554]|uniref:M23 family metallopeptidase n=1 Tax=Nonomuraea sp. NPDC000554 TaxID=3154259 RepID=UPI0033287BEB